MDNDEEDDLKSPMPFKSPNVSLRKRLESGSSNSSKGHSPSSLQSNHHFGDENEPPPLPGCSGHNAEVETSRVNPFEKDILAGLQRSFWSPSIMDIKETPPQRSWAIEHLAHLFPKDIENSPSTHQNAFPVDPQAEAKAQADIDTYFGRGPIVPTPSPMKEKLTKVQCMEMTRIDTMKFNNVPYIHCGYSPIARGSAAGGIGLGYSMKKNKKTTSGVDKWSQTTLSFPNNLPEYIEKMLSPFLQTGELCGTSGDTEDQHSSQTSNFSEQVDGTDNDPGKNSSSLNNSIRRRLDLSFGEDPNGEELTGGPASPIVDPFRQNHLVSTPPDLSNGDVNTTTSDIEVQLMRCEFTPEARRMAIANTPGITPIHDEPDEMRLNSVCSTPRRMNTINKRSSLTEGAASVLSSMDGFPNVFNPINSGISDDDFQNNMRRCRGETTQAHKRYSTSSFEDSHLMDVSSPPSKLHRRSSENS